MNGPTSAPRSSWWIKAAFFATVGRQIARSSNGRTTDSESVYLGSNPSLAARNIMQNILATYHKDCIDGTTAAAVLLRKFPEAQLFPLKHGYAPEDIAPALAALTPKTVVYTLDCGLGVQEFLTAGNKVTTIDHHIGGKEEFETLVQNNPNYTYIFNNDKSGASLTWATLFPDEAQPELIALVEDSDLWKHQLGDDTKHVNNYLSMYRDDPATVRILIDSSLSEIKDKGKVITAYADKEVESQTKILPITIRIKDWDVSAYNITVYQSAAGNILSGKLEKAVALFTIKGDQVRISFRSKDGQTPIALELAQSLGGGCHNNAAGANMPLKDFLQVIR
ncbi:MAG: putative phosphoesterase, dhha1 [Candidatus Adlerbacteria bacterium]|nr:putative phosphoesterase, dhha1 [Candidatus Adlerbacteria bacterium]